MGWLTTRRRCLGGAGLERRFYETLLIPASRRTKGFETGNPHETQQELAATTVIQRSAKCRSMLSPSPHRPLLDRRPPVRPVHSGYQFNRVVRANRAESEKRGGFPYAKT